MEVILKLDVASEQSVSLIHCLRFNDDGMIIIVTGDNIIQMYAAMATRDVRRNSIFGSSGAPRDSQLTIGTGGEGGVGRFFIGLAHTRHAHNYTYFFYIIFAV